MSGDPSTSFPLSEDTSRRRLLALMGAGGAAALVTLGPSEAKAGHDTTNVMHLGETNSAPGSSTIDANVDGPMLLLNNSHSSGTSLHAHKPVGIFVDVEQLALMVVNEGAGGGAIEAASKAGGIGVEGSVFPTDEDLEFEDQKNGYGVRGIAMSPEGGYGEGPGVGVHGQAGIGTGVLGITSAQGIGVEARTHSPDGIALVVNGPSKFSTAGSAVVPAGQNSVFVANDTVTGDSHISVTLVSDPGSRSVLWIQRNPGNGFTVHMSSASPTKRPATSFTYLVVEPA